MPAKPKVITFHYILTNVDGDVLDRTDDAPFACLTGVGQIIEGLETALLEMKAGDKKTVNVPAERAYGERDDALVMKVAKAQLPEDLEIEEGQYLQGPDGQVVTVVGIDDTHVFLDANHPLAGENLNFDVTIVETRDANEEEVAHGHAHGPHGHHHH